MDNGSYKDLRHYKWKGLRDKMRYMRLCYTKAVVWRSNTKPDDFDDEVCAEFNIRHQTRRLCEDFDALDAIFQGKIDADKKMNTVKGESSSSYDEETAEMAHIPDESFMETNPKEEIVIPINFEKDSDGSTSSANNLAMLSEVQQERTKFHKEKLLRTMEIEERKMRLEEDRLFFEREKFQKEFNARREESERMFSLEKFKVEKELELKKLEIELKYNVKQTDQA